MRKWEDIVKDKLEGYESSLPEDGLAAFRARRAGSAPTAKRYSWVGVLAAAAAAAAGLAALLLPPRPAVPEDAVQIVQSQPVAEVIVPDSADVSEPASGLLPFVQPLVQPGTPKATRRVAAALSKNGNVTEESTRKAFGYTEETVNTTEPAKIPEPSTDSAVSEDKKPVPDDARWAGSPFVPQAPPARKVQLKVTPVAGAVAGGGLLAALLTPMTQRGTLYTYTRNTPVDELGNMPTPSGQNSPNGSLMDGADYLTSCLWTDTSSPYNNQFEGETSVSVDPEGSTDGPPGSLPNELANNMLQDVLCGAYTHYRPLKTGLSARIPLTEKLSLTTGLTYSLYCSKFTYSLSGEKAQQAHYLGIPVRLDWTLASNRWLDVYVGTGIAGDLCIGSSLGGNAFAKDGPSFSVLGAGGLQWNMTKRLGLYVEPELSWTAPSDKHVLKTYRQEHPFVFTVATGLRINLGR